MIDWKDVRKLLKMVPAKCVKRFGTMIRGFEGERETTVTQVLFVELVMAYAEINELHLEIRELHAEAGIERAQVRKFLNERVGKFPEGN